MTSPVVFLLDVDNTLLDNDRVAADLKRHLVREVGAARAEEYWACSSSCAPSSATTSCRR